MSQLEVTQQIASPALDSTPAQEPIDLTSLQHHTTGEIGTVERAQLQASATPNDSEILAALDAEPDSSATHDSLLETLNAQVTEAYQRGELSRAASLIEQHVQQHPAHPAIARLQAVQEAIKSEQVEALRGTDQDPAVQAMQEEIRRMEEAEQRQLLRINGTEKTIGEYQEQLDNMSWLSKQVGSVDENIAVNIEVEQQFKRDQVEWMHEFREQRREQQERLNTYQKMQAEGRYLEAEGELEAAQEAYNMAQTALQQFGEHSGGQIQIVNDAYRNGMAEVRKGYEDAIASLDRTEAYARTGITLTVVVGATVATGGAALALGGGILGTAGGIAAGTATGTIIGGAAAFTEAVGDATNGNQSWSNALSEATGQSLQHAQTALISSVAAAAGGSVSQALGGAGGQAVTKIAGEITGRAVQPVITGGVFGATNATVHSGANMAIQYHQALSQFQQEYADIPPEQREEALYRFMKERGLTRDQMIAQFGKDVAWGTVGGMFGGGMSGLQQSISGARSRVVAATGEALGDVGLGIMEASMSSNIDTGQAVLMSLAGSVGGRLSAATNARTSSGRSAHAQSPLEVSPNTLRGEVTPNPEIGPTNRVNHSLHHAGPTVAHLRAVQTEPPQILRDYLGERQADWYTQKITLPPEQVDPFFTELARARGGTIALGGGSDLTQITLGVPKAISLAPGTPSTTEVNLVFPKDVYDTPGALFEAETIHFTVPAFGVRPASEVTVSVNGESSIDLDIMVRNHGNQNGDYILKDHMPQTTAHAPLKQASVVLITSNGQAEMYFRTPRDYQNYIEKKLDFPDAERFEPAEWVDRAIGKDLHDNHGLPENVVYATTLLSRGNADGWIMTPESDGILREMISRLTPDQRAYVIDRLDSNMRLSGAESGLVALPEIQQEYGLSAELVESHL